MKARTKELLEQAVAAMVVAIDAYNRPGFPYRGETFANLALNAWELLLKARWLAKNKNRLSSLYVRQGRSDQVRPRYKRSRSGSPLTHSVDYLAKKLAEDGALHANARRNLEALIEVRDVAAHFYHRDGELGERLQELGMACVKNFVAAVKDWFYEDLSRLNLCLMPLSFVATPPVVEGVRLSNEEKKFLRFLADTTGADDDPGAPYSVAVNIEMRFVRSKASDALQVRITDDPVAPAVRLSEEQVRERYPWDYWELTRKCQGRYGDFKVDRHYHTLRKALEGDARYGHVRLLDPKKPKSGRKTFYNPNILQEFDRHYRRKEAAA